MDEDQIVEMLKDIIEQVDYDVYKELFVFDEDTEGLVDKLVEIVQEHLDN